MRMLSRDTHARIYQGELSSQRCEKLRSTGDSGCSSVKELVLSAVKDYLKNWEGTASLDVEEVVLSNDRIRFFLWLPYVHCSEFCHLMIILKKDAESDRRSSRLSKKGVVHRFSGNGARVSPT